MILSDDGKILIEVRNQDIDENGGFTIPDSVTIIGNNAFRGCTGLTQITIPDSVTSIWEDAFFGCAGLKQITIPESVMSIGGMAFLGCIGLTQITIPDSVTIIGEFAFCGCIGLTQMTIPEDVMIMGDSVFEDCTSLVNIIVEGNIDNIKKLLPNELHYKIISKDDYQCALAIQEEAIDKIYQANHTSAWHDYLVLLNAPEIALRTLLNAPKAVLRIIDSYVAEHAGAEQARKTMIQIPIRTFGAVGTLNGDDTQYDDNKRI